MYQKVRNFCPFTCCYQLDFEYNLPEAPWGFGKPVRSKVTMEDGCNAWFDLASSAFAAGKELRVCFAQIHGSLLFPMKTFNPGYAVCWFFDMQSWLLNDFDVVLLVLVESPRIKETSQHVKDGDLKLAIWDGDTDTS